MDLQLAGITKGKLSRNTHKRLETYESAQFDSFEENVMNTRYLSSTIVKQNSTIGLANYKEIELKDHDFAKKLQSFYDN